MTVFLRRIWIQITADRKRFGMLCGMVVLGLLLWSRLILVSKVPRTAVADPVAAETDGPARPTSASAPRGSAAGAAKRPGDAGKRSSSAAPARSGKSLPVIVVALDDIPSRDPFQVSMVHFPKPNSLARLAQDASKSAAQTSEDSQAAKDPVLQRLKALVSRMQLEAVMRGTPVAVISGRTCRLHETFALTEAPDFVFRLVKIQDRTVVVECLDLQFTLTLRPKLESP